MVEVTMVAVIVAVVVVVKVPLRSIINMVVVVAVLSIGVLADAEVIVVGVIAIVSKLRLSVADAPSGVAVNSFVNAWMLDFLSGIRIERLTSVSGANALAVVMDALEFPVSTPLEECSR